MKKKYTKKDIERIYGEKFFTKIGEVCENCDTLNKNNHGPCVCCNPERAIEYMNEWGEIPPQCFS